jgi:hypothetical protein
MLELGRDLDFAEEPLGTDREATHRGAIRTIRSSPSRITPRRRAMRVPLFLYSSLGASSTTNMSKAPALSTKNTHSEAVSHLVRCR